MKIRGEVVSSQMLGKRIFRVPPTGVEPMTFQNSGRNTGILEGHGFDSRWGNSENPFSEHLT